MHDEQELSLTRQQLMNTLGDSGTTRYAGYFQEEPNTKWRDNERVDTVEEMRRGDGAIKAVLNAIKAPILATEWRVEYVDDSSRGEEIREFVEHNIFDMRRHWNEFLRESLAYLDFGHYVFELIFELKDGQIWLVDLEPRIPASIQAWQISDKKFGIQQLIRTDEKEGLASLVEIPGEKLLVLTNDKEGDDVTGQSILRPAYIHWKIKNTLYRVSGIAADRYGVGVPVLTLPEIFSQDQKDKAEEMTQNLRSNEKSYVVLPFGFELEIKTPNGNPQGQSINELIEHHNRMIYTSTLEQFLGLGGDSAGSFALSKDQTSFFLEHVQEKAMYLTNQLNKQVIERLVKLNFGEQEVYPEIKFTPLGDTNYKELSEVLNVLQLAGFITVRPADEQWTRQTFKLPELTDQELADLEQKKIEDTEMEKQVKSEMGNPEDDEKKKLSEVCHFLGERAFILPRKLTEQEDRVDMRKFNEQFNERETELEDEVITATLYGLDIFNKSLQNKLDAGDIAAIAGLSFAMLGRVRKALGKAIHESYEFGKTGVSKELGVDRPNTPLKDTSLMSLDIDDLSREYVFELERHAKGLAKDALSAGASAESIVSVVSQKTKDHASRMISNISGTVVGQYVNRGRNRVIFDNLIKTVSLQRSEVLDSRTCPMCLSLDKRVIKPDDPIGKLDIVHTHCRGLWIPILTLDEEKPAITGIPKTVIESFELVDGRPTVNAFKQLRKPINKANKEVQDLIRRKMGI